MQEKLLFVEFLGLPGAGKTTIANQTVRGLQKLDFNVYTRDLFMADRASVKPRERRIRYFSFCVRNFLLLLTTIRYANSIKPFNIDAFDFGYQFFRIANKMNEACRYATRRKCQIIVFDQGVLQALSSIALSGQMRSRSLLKRRMLHFHNHLFDGKDMFIPFINVEIEIANQRIRQRPSFESRFDRMDTEVSKIKLSENAKNLLLIFETVLELERVKGLTMSNNQDYDYSLVDSIIPKIVDTYKNFTNN